MAIPFLGRGCAYCGADKARDQHAHSTRLLYATVLGVVGWLLAGFWGALGGATVGVAVATWRTLR